MRVNIYRNYRFIDKDPIIDALRTVVQDEGLSEYQASQITGVAPSTYKNWFRGETRRPNNATSTQTAAALGYIRRDEMRADGQVVIGYVKAREIDEATERKKMADWILKTRGPKKKRPKRNGKMPRP